METEAEFRTLDGINIGSLYILMILSLFALNIFLNLRLWMDIEVCLMMVTAKNIEVKPLSSN